MKKRGMVLVLSVMTGVVLSFLVCLVMSTAEASEYMVRGTFVDETTDQECPAELRIDVRLGTATLTRFSPEDRDVVVLQEEAHFGPRDCEIVLRQGNPIDHIRAWISDSRVLDIYMSLDPEIIEGDSEEDPVVLRTHFHLYYWVDGARVGRLALDGLRNVEDEDLDLPPPSTTPGPGGSRVRPSDRVEPNRRNVIPR